MFTSIDVPGGIRTNTLGINPEGDIVGRYDTPDGRARITIESESAGARSQMFES
jgi:hypothetical protein